MKIIIYIPHQVPTKYTQNYSNMGVQLRQLYAGMVTGDTVCSKNTQVHLALGLLTVIGVIHVALDEGVGQIAQALKDNSLFDDTIIIFSTDNGGNVKSGASNYPLSGNKATLYEGGKTYVIVYSF